MKESDFWLWITGNNVANNFSFFAKTDRLPPEYIPRSQGINSVLPDMLFVYSECAVAAELHFMNHHGPQFHLKLFFTVLLKKKHLYLDELTVSKLTGEMFIFVWTMPLIQQSTSYTQNRNRLEEAAVKRHNIGLVMFFCFPLWGFTSFPLPAHNY